MAFATLPYPSMDFTPLDVLTADELDQLVANINAVNNGTVSTATVADGAITTAKVADKAITEAKIDRTSLLAPIMNGQSIANTNTTTSWTDKTSIDISSLPVGTHFVAFATAWARCTTAPSTFSIRPHYDSNYGYVAWSGADDVEGLHTGTSFGVFTKASGKNTVYANITWLDVYHVDDGHIDLLVIPC